MKAIGGSKMLLSRSAAMIALAGLLAVPQCRPAELVLADMTTNLVPHPVPYAVLLPDGYRDSNQPLPLLIMLHGGGGSRDMLASFKPMFEELWQAGRLSKMIVTAPSTASRGFYMDRKDGKEQWET